MKNPELGQKLIMMGEVLRTAPQEKQIRKQLVKTSQDFMKMTFSKKRVEGYCALGYLGCAKGVFKNYQFADINEMDYGRILGAYGIQNAMADTVWDLTSLGVPKDHSTYFLDTAIAMANDRGKTFKEIGEWLIRTGEAML